MKRLMVLCVAVAFVAAAMMSGCAGQKYSGPGTMTGGEGAAKQPMDMGKPATAGAITTGGEGAAKPGVQAPQPK